MNRKTALVLLFFVVAAIAIVTGALYLKSHNKSIPPPSSKTRAKSSLPAPKPKTVKELMNADIKLVFDAQKYPALIAAANQAFNELNGKKEYLDYVQTFQEMVKAYSQTKDAKQRQVLVELRNYSRANPDYKESDWVIPK